MKNELIELISNELLSKIYKNEAIQYSVDIIDFYESQRNKTAAKFYELLKKYNYETIANLVEHTEYPYLTLYHSSSEFKFWPMIDYEGEDLVMEKEIGLILTEPELFLTAENYNSNIQDEMYDIEYEIKHSIAFVYLCTIWQEIEGFKFGILTKTLENNSARQFIFNDFAWKDFSKYDTFNDRKVRLTNEFERDFTVSEFYQRVKYKSKFS